MKTSILKACLLFVAAIALAPFIANATVGGPTYVYDFKYNPANESVYYIQVSESGRGCPPELKKISLNTGISSTVFSCEQGEKLMGDTFNPLAVNQEIARLTKNFKALTPINLIKNNIALDLDFVRTETLEGDPSWVIRSHFTADVYQNNKKAVTLPIVGCSAEQPFIFAGYAIPGFNKKIVLLSSAKGDCFEGGYIGESLHVVGGVDNLDITSAGDWKPLGPLVPSVATLVVFEKDEIGTATSGGIINPKTPGAPASDAPEDDGYSTSVLVLAGIIALAIGLAVGMLLRKRTL